MAEEATTTEGAEAPAPEPTGTPIERAMERAQARLDSEDAGPATTPKAEASTSPTSEDGHTPPVVTTTDGGSEPAGDSAGDGEPDPGADDLIPTDPAKASVWLKARDEKAAADAATELETKLEHQRRSMRGQWEAVQERDQRSETITELEELDPIERAERLEDPATARLWADHKAVVSTDAKEAVDHHIREVQGPQLLAAIDAIGVEYGAGSWQEVLTDDAIREINEDTATSTFGFVMRHAAQAAQAKAVATFRESDEWKTLIADAEQRGAQDALGGRRLTPPPVTGSRPSSSGSETLPDDPVERAAVKAAAALGLEPLTESDRSQFRTRGKGRRVNVDAAS